MKYCQFGVSPINHSDSDSENRRCADKSPAGLYEKTTKLHVNYINSIDRGDNLTAMADVNTSNVSTSNVPASNPLSKKLNKILETRLDNDKVFCYDCGGNQCMAPPNL